MAGELDTKGRATALNLITRFGTTITFSRVTNAGDYDPADGSVSNRTRADETVVALPTKPDREFERADVTEDREVVILVPASALTWEPAPNTVATFDGAEYTVLRVEKVKPGLQPILYKLHCRRSQEG